MPKIENKKTRVIFMGTPDFALPGLASLIAVPELEIVGIFTQPDKPVGRGRLMTPPPVKILAQKHNLKVFQPEKIKSEFENIRDLHPDLIIVIAYGKIIPQKILDIPRYGCLNVHASLLPQYRGAACLNAPILNGDEKTGVTIMKMEAGLDTGPILRQAEIKLNGTENLAILHDQLALLGAKILVPTLFDWIDGKTEPQAQDEAKAIYVKMLSKEDGRIDWKKPAEEIERMIRAYNPWPGAFSTWQNKVLKIISAKKEVLKNQKLAPGTFFKNQENLAIQCGQGALLILKLQLEGKKIMEAPDFLRGNAEIIGQRLL